MIVLPTEPAKVLLVVPTMPNGAIKDRQQLIWPILVRSQYIEDYYGTP